jgi:TonB family protein
MFRAVQKRLVPLLIRDEFRLAKSAYAGQNAAEAEEHFTRARRLLTEAEKLDAIDDALVDLRTIVDGFLELSHARTNRAAPSSIDAPGASAVAQTAREAATTGGEAPSIAVPLGREITAVKVYTSGDAGVTPPVAVRQVMPAVPVDLVRILKTGSGRRGALDIVIDERGTVQDAVMRESMNAMYDDILVTAARRWKFQPAMKDGVPVPFRKTILIDSRP